MIHAEAMWREATLVGRTNGFAWFGGDCLDGTGRKMTELREDSAGKPVTMKVGSRVRVALREAGGTGYRWRVGEGCAAILRLERDQTEKEDGRPGASVEREWVYTAAGAGTCELRFESARSWEKSVTGKVVVFPVTVEGGAR